MTKSCLNARNAIQHQINSAAICIPWLCINKPILQESNSLIIWSEGSQSTHPTSEQTCAAVSSSDSLCVLFTFTRTTTTTTTCCSALKEHCRSAHRGRWKERFGHQHLPPPLSPLQQPKTKHIHLAKCQDSSVCVSVCEICEVSTFNHPLNEQEQQIKPRRNFTA